MGVIGFCLQRCNFTSPAQLAFYFHHSQLAIFLSSRYTFAESIIFVELKNALCIEKMHCVGNTKVYHYIPYYFFNGLTIGFMENTLIWIQFIARRLSCALEWRNFYSAKDNTTKLAFCNEEDFMLLQKRTNTQNLHYFWHTNDSRWIFFWYNQLFFLCWKHLFASSMI